MFVVDLKNTLYSLVRPRSSSEDKKRREFILNILLLSSLVLCAIATFLSTFNFLLKGSAYNGNHPLFVFSLFLLFLVLFLLSRRGFISLAAYTFLGLYILPICFAIFHWSLYIPQASLILALIIVMSGILIGSQFAFFATTGLCLFILMTANLQISGRTTVDMSWIQDLKPQMSDAVILSFSLMSLMVVSWLFNREMRKALERAIASEKALKKQRDKLEIIVEKRTNEIKRIQAEKFAQLYRFAELGKSTSGLFHDLVTPLTLTSLNLSKLNKDIHKPELANAKTALERAMIGTQRMESFIQAARRQIQNQEITKKFSLSEEIKLAIELFSHKAEKRHIKIAFSVQKDSLLTGNPIKLNQVLANIIANAIDSYEHTDSRKKELNVRLSRIGKRAIIEVQDFGAGIDPHILPNIFDLLFTTKNPEHGTGIGLTISKEIIERDFRGKCSVESQKGVGTTFRIELPLK